MRSCQSLRYLVISAILVTLLLCFSSLVHLHINNIAQYDHYPLVQRSEPNNNSNPTPTQKDVAITVKTKEGPTEAGSKLQNRDEHDKDDDKATITTEINIIYTTIVYNSASPPSSIVTTVPIHNMTNIGSAHQEGERQQTKESPSGLANATISNSTTNSNIAESLKDDQQALKRMVMIVSLVGGIGFIAVATTVVIFTRMRTKNRKQRQMGERDISSTFELYSDDRRGGNHSNSNNHSGSSGMTNDNSFLNYSSANHQEQRSRHNHHQHNSSYSYSSDSVSTCSHLSNDGFIDPVEPSAPPLTIENQRNELSTQERYIPSYHEDRSSRLPKLQRPRRYVLSMSSQTSAHPTPSAPTAKELDAMIEDDYHHFQPTTSTHRFTNHHHHHDCPNCSNLMVSSAATPTLVPTAPYPVPEIPPPAYTPTAPPYHALPVEAMAALNFAENIDAFNTSATADPGITNLMVQSSSENDISGTCASTTALSSDNRRSTPPLLPPRRHSAGG